MKSLLEAIEDYVSAVARNEGIESMTTIDKYYKLKFELEALDDRIKELENDRHK